MPVATGATIHAVLNTMGNVSQIINTRSTIRGVSSGDSGVSSGHDFINSENIWFKPFYSHSNQKDKNGVIGFKTDGYGVVAGVDTIKIENWRLGVAVSYSKIKLKSNDSEQGIGIDSYNLSTYGTYALNPQTQLNFQLGGGYNKNNSTRYAELGNSTFTGNYDSNSIQALLGLDHVMNITENTSFIYTMHVDYKSIKNKGYTETKKEGTLPGLKVLSQNTHQFSPEFEGKIRHQVNNNLMIEGYGGIGYDFLNKQVSVNAQFVGGSDIFKTLGVKPSPWSVRSGVAAGYNHNDQVQFSINYDREDKGSDFSNYTISGRIRLSF